MDLLEFETRLEALKGDDYFSIKAEEVIEDLKKNGYVSDECLGVVLRFMERNPEVDWGVPGSLTWFLEDEFIGRGYAEELVASIQREATTQTLFMLNRLINGTSDPAARGRLLEVLASVANDPRVDWDERDVAKDFYDYQMSKHAGQQD